MNTTNPGSGPLRYCVIIEERPLQRQQGAQGGVREKTVLVAARPSPARESGFRSGSQGQRMTSTLQGLNPRGGFNRHAFGGKLHELGQTSQTRGVRQDAPAARPAQFLAFLRHRGHRGPARQQTRPRGCRDLILSENGLIGKHRHVSQRIYPPSVKRLAIGIPL